MHIKMSCPFRVRSTISSVESQPSQTEFYDYLRCSANEADAKLTRKLVKMEQNYLKWFTRAAAAVATVAALHFNNNLITFALEMFSPFKRSNQHTHRQTNAPAKDEMQRELIS